MNKTLVFDMDGTIANFYMVSNWLDDLRNENPRPYIVAEPMYDMASLGIILNLLKERGWRIAVTSWLAKDSTEQFKKLVRKAKREWLEKYSFPFDEIHLVQYGATKANSTRKNGGFQIIVDDNAEVRKGWHLGGTIDANKDILSELIALYLAEVA